MRSFVVGDKVQLQIIEIDDWSFIVWHKFPPSLMCSGIIIPYTNNSLGLRSEPDAEPGIFCDFLNAPSDGGCNLSYLVSSYNREGMPYFHERLLKLLPKIDSFITSSPTQRFMNTNCTKFRNGEEAIIVRRAGNRVQIWFDSAIVPFVTNEMEMVELSHSPMIDTTHINIRCRQWNGYPFISQDFLTESKATRVYYKVKAFMGEYINRG